jgi:glucosylceramidase
MKKSPSTADSYVTARGTGSRLESTRALAFVDFPQPRESEPFVLVDPDKTFQTLIGIGAAITDASADTFAALPDDRQEKVVRAFFDPKDGIGYTLARTNMHSCDFSSAPYTYAADGDKSLASFSIAHDLENRLPLIKRAIAAAGGGFTLFASPWSPPAWMKDNDDILHGGRLKPEYYQTWADYFVRFLNAYEQQGVPVWGVTVQNEPMASQPWESCNFTAAQERDFLKFYLGPTLRKAGLGDRKILIWDHNRDLMFQYASVILDDPAAAKYAWGVAYHWYEDSAGGEPLHDNVRRLVEAYPNKPPFFSEGCSWPTDPQKTLKLDDWSLGERYGREMIKDFNNGTVAWTDWNVLLDERGGPNHAGNFCYAALHVDAKTHELHWTNIYPYMGHFSKFIRPGARRTAVAPSRDALKSTAFLNPDGSLAVVVMNETETPVDYRLWIKGKAALVTSLPRSIATFVVRQ